MVGPDSHVASLLRITDTTFKPFLTFPVCVKMNSLLQLSEQKDNILNFGQDIKETFICVMFPQIIIIKSWKKFLVETGL